MLFEPDRISTILNALDIYEDQLLPSIVEDEAKSEYAMVAEIRDFLNKILDKKTA